MIVSKLFLNASETISTVSVSNIFRNDGARFEPVMMRTLRSLYRIFRKSVCVPCVSSVRKAQDTSFENSPIKKGC